MRIVTVFAHKVMTWGKPEGESVSLCVVQRMSGSTFFKDVDGFED